MSTVRTLHHRAMDLAAQAMYQQAYDPQMDTRPLNREALALEVQAAYRLPWAAEPSRGVLFRSAAWLAIHAGEYAHAVTLADQGLRGHPPGAIADELREARAAALQGGKA